ncbi:MAG: hypothetical protein ABF636_10260, partial [Acetobacter sp.]
MQDVDDTASGSGDHEPGADAAPDAPHTEEAHDATHEPGPQAEAPEGEPAPDAHPDSPADAQADTMAEHEGTHDATADAPHAGQGEHDEHAEQGAHAEHGATPDEDPFGSHLLDQSEIDNLLGHTFGGFEEPEETGMERV